MSASKRDFIRGGAIVAAAGLLPVLAACGDASASSPAPTLNDTNDLANRIQLLEAESAIRKKIATYARACDRLDTALAATIFAPNSTADYGTNPLTGQVIYKGTGVGLMEYLHQVDSGIYAAGGQFQHVQCQSYIEVDGDKAASETYGFAVVVVPQGATMAVVSVGLARYLDSWSLINGDWLIVSRRVTSDGGYTITTGSPPYPQYNFAIDKSDPSYAVLGAIPNS